VDHWSLLIVCAGGLGPAGYGPPARRLGLPRQDGLAIMAPDVLLPMAGEPAMGS